MITRGFFPGTSVFVLLGASVTTAAPSPIRGLFFIVASLTASPRLLVIFTVLVVSGVFIVTTAIAATSAVATTVLASAREFLLTLALDLGRVVWLLVGDLSVGCLGVVPVLGRRVEGLV